MKKPKKVIIVGASSGIGLRIARIYASRGCAVGVAARRIEALKSLKDSTPGIKCFRAIDVTAETAPAELLGLINDLGGADLIVNCAGIGYLNPQLDPEKDIATVATNCLGFTRMADTAFEYLTASGGGRFAAVSSVAATMGLGLSASYSASKRFEATYMQALNQLARLRKSSVRVTDIRPGFIATPLLDPNRHYPMLMNPDKASARIVRAIDRGKRVAVINRRWSLLTALWHLIPGWLWVRLPIKISL